MSENIIGRVTFERPDALNEAFGALRKLAGKGEYLRIEAGDLLTFTVGYPKEMFSEIALQPKGAMSGLKHSTFEVTNFEVEIPFKVELRYCENLLKKLGKFKGYDKVKLEHIHRDEHNFNDTLRLTVNGFVDEFKIEENEVFSPMNTYFQNAYEKEPKKFCFLNKDDSGTIEAMTSFGKELAFLSKNYLESIGREITSNVFIGRNENTKKHFGESAIISATNGFTAYVNTMNVVSNDETFFVQIGRKNADALGSVMSNKKLFSGKATLEIADAWKERIAYPQQAENCIRNFVAKCKVFEKFAFFEFTANETMAHFTVMVKQPETSDGLLDAIHGVFAPCLEYKKEGIAFEIKDFLQESERVAKNSQVTFKDIYTSIVCEVNVLNKDESLGSFRMENQTDNIFEDVELCLNTEFLRTACKALELNSAKLISFSAKQFDGEKDGVVLLNGENEAAPYIALMPIRK